jgi:hypothetical protein
MFGQVDATVQHVPFVDVEIDVQVETRRRNANVSSNAPGEILLFLNAHHASAGEAAKYGTNAL